MSIAVEGGLILTRSCLECYAYIERFCLNFIHCVRVACRAVTERIVVWYTWGDSDVILMPAGFLN